MNFVSFDLAKKLKEKGFSEKCLAYYDVDDNVGLLYNTQYTDDISPCQYMDLMLSRNSGEGGGECDNSECCIDAPTISQVLNWLRKEKKIFMPINLVYCYEDDEHPFSTNPDMIPILKGYYYGVWDLNNINDRYGRSECFETPELATIAGIEYVLDNLI